MKISAAAAPLIAAAILFARICSAADSSSVEDRFPEFFRADPAVPRPYVDLLPPSMRASAPEPVSCGADLDVYSGDSHLLEEFGEECSWDLTVHAGVSFDLMCSFLYVPCGSSASMDFTFSLPNSGSTLAAESFCDNEFYEEVTFRFRNVDLDYVLHLEVDGGYFSCLAKGTGGETDPNDNGDGDDGDDDSIQPADCGLTRYNAQIVGGDPAEEHEYPWMAALYLGGFFCGGSLINSEWVMTAAHCTDGVAMRDMTVQLGCRDRPDSGCAERRGVREVFIHEGWRADRYTIQNDISLIRLSSPVDLDDDRIINAACLPSEATPVNGYTLRVAGWGRTSDDATSISDQLMEARVRTKSDSECQFNYDDDDFICAERLSGSSCNGDSGSFVGSVRGGKYEQDGVVSFGGQVCSRFDMGFTEVYNYLDWIRDVITNNSD